MEKRQPPLGVVVMGPCGSGKTEIGVRLSSLMECPFVDADDLHPMSNIVKMKAGTPLSDGDRLPWLEAVRGEMERVAVGSPEGPVGVVAACSALKVSYRNVLRSSGLPGGGGDGKSMSPVFVYLSCPKEVLEQRLSLRKDHFMKSSMLESQLGILEVPEEKEMGDSVVVDASESVASVAESIAEELRKRWIKSN